MEQKGAPTFHRRLTLKQKGSYFIINNNNSFQTLWDSSQQDHSLLLLIPTTFQIQYKKNKHIKKNTESKVQLRRL